MKRGYKKSGNCFAPLKPPSYAAPLLLCLFFTAFNLGALDISRGRIRLSLHERSGRFSLYGINSGGRYEPFFSDSDPRTSFIELNVNNRIYRLGDTTAFVCRAEGGGETPSIIFESADFLVRQEFSFIQTAGSPAVNGVRIAVRLRNLRQNAVQAGLRVLLDASLGEGRGKTPFFMDGGEIAAETLITGSVTRPWVSRGTSLSLMGSVGRAPETVPPGKNPDYLHFANQKRLSEASWKSAYSTDRDFSYPPNSAGDAAVCYYYEPGPLQPSGEFLCVILLAAEDTSGFAHVRAAPAVAAPVPASLDAAASPSPAASPENANSLKATASSDNAASSGTDAAREADLALLQSLMARLNYYTEKKIDISDEELSEMEETITRLKNRYNITQ